MTDDGEWGYGDNMAETEERDKRIKVVVRNRRASYDYEFLQRYEAGIALVGSEVKSIRAGNIMLVDSYATIEDDGLILKNMHIGAYEQASGIPHDPTRPRRLLLHKTELRKIARQTLEKGLTLIPVQVYFKGPLVKIELAVARGRKKYDKRQALMKKDTDREIRRAGRDNQ